MLPTERGILSQIAEYQRIGRKAFLEKYANNRPSKDYFLVHQGALFDAKALWASSHRPPIQPRDTNSITARKHLASLGFEIIGNEEAIEFAEGERFTKERSYFRRNKSLVEEAKRRYGTDCKACGFSFEAAYGEIGAGYIECHHLEPMSMGEERATTLDKVTVLCANCHRVAHKRNPPYSVAELRRNLRK